MKYRFIQAHRSLFSVERMCSLLGISRSGYYDWRQRRPSQRTGANGRLLEEIRRIHEGSYRTYGSPRVTAALRRQGIVCGRNRVARLMQLHEIVAKTKRRFKATTNSRHHYPVAPNLLRQELTITGTNQVWVADITYVWTAEGWLYLAAILDLYSRRVVGWGMKDRLTQELVLAAWEQACGWRQPPPGLIHHSDQGGQYACERLQQSLTTAGCQISMSRRGNCYDNAYMESFFSSLKRELIFHERFLTREEAQKKIFEYIEIFYNRNRLHSSLGYQTPVEFEQELYDP